MVDLGMLVLRLGLGIMFMAHGLQKAFGLFSGPGIKGFSEALSGLGFGYPVFWAYIAAYTELIGGLFLILGLFTRGASALLLILMLVAVFKVHAKKGFFLSQGGFEYAFVIICALVAVILSGPAEYSVIKRF